ncbi:MAG: response regulator [Candidatus Omnitrophica bacterium]|nr:response regulator [Candidatus Omnitrophota bacterium]
MTKPVLIVDDDEGVADTVRQVLEHAGYASDHCQESPKAVSFLERKSYGCVLLDIRMPKMEGTEVIQLIKKKYPDLPVIIVSAFADGPDSTYYSSLGAFDVVAKPFSNEVLVRAVNRAAGDSDVTRLTLTGLNLDEARDQIYRKLIVKALNHCSWNQQKAAEVLGISRYALNRWLRKLEIKF